MSHRREEMMQLNSLQWLAVLAIVLLMAGCSLHPNYSQQPDKSSYPEVNQLLAKDYSFDEIEHQVNALVTHGPLNKALLKNNAPEVSRLIFLAKSLGVSRAVARLSAESPERTEDFITMALLVFPFDSDQVVETLLLDQTLPEDEILTAALRAGVYSDSVFGATAAAADPLIVPLINSASVTLFEQNETASAAIQYREAGSDTWQDALPLAWEPERSALSGSIVNLTANTRYQLRVLRSNADGAIDPLNLEFTTRPDKPPVNPDLVYQLSDIYSGSGVLDLEQLNIQGEADGWAKIVGNDALPVIADENDRAAINIGGKSYIVFENITVKGGRHHAIVSEFAHHLWFDGCDVSGWGRKAGHYQNGKAYESATDDKPINYDAGFFLKKSGVVVIENCQVHSPTPKANHWGYGHPSGPSALLLLANHPETAYQGQYIVRHNRFYGTADHRYNDVIESRSNGRRWGGFLRDSAIHDNYLAYANDDVVELDGGQSNVLFYNNEIEQGFCGVSAVPNMLGPSYIFNNYIHNLGDERGSAWAAIKLGGLHAAPSGKTYILQNLIIANSNGIAQSAFKGDKTYWARVQNNVIITTFYREGYKKGLGMLDEARFHKSEIINNVFYNTVAQQQEIDADVDIAFHGEIFDAYGLDELLNIKTLFLAVPDPFKLNNFSFVNGQGKLIIGLL